MDSESVYFNNISLSNNETIFLKTKWTAMGINLLIVDEGAVWEGFLPKWEIESKSKDLEVAFEGFFNNTKEALTTTTDKFVYELSQGCFQWTKVEEVKIIYGSVSMKETEYSDTEIRNEMINAIKELRLQLATKATELNELKGSYDKCLKEYDKIVESRKEDENELLSKVVELLNSKKRRIEILEDNIRRSDSTRGNISISSELDPESQKNSQNSNFSSQEIDARPLPKRLKLPDKTINYNQLKTERVVEGPSKDSPVDDDVYNKDTLDLSLENNLL